MKYINIPGVKLPVSKIVYGTATEPFMGGGDGDELFEAMLSLGITTIDTAQNYTGAEVSIGKWLARTGRREQVTILSKCGHPDTSNWIPRVNEKEMRQDLNGSLRDLKTDYIDIYLLHRDDLKTDVGVAVEVFNAMHAEGKIRAFGGSNWDFRRIEAANEYAYAHNLIPFTVSSPNFGVARQVVDPYGGGCIGITGEEHAEDRKWYAENQMAVIAYSGLARGFFSGKVKSTDETNVESLIDVFAVKAYAHPENFKRLKRAEELAVKKAATVSQIALAYIFNSGLNACAIVSTRSLERMKQNVAALDIVLSREEMDYLSLK